MNWKIAAVYASVIASEINGRAFEPFVRLNQIRPENVWLNFLVEPTIIAFRKHSVDKNQNRVGVIVAMPDVIVSRLRNELRALKSLPLNS